MMTPAARRALITRPFPVVHVQAHSYPWAGRLIGDRLTLEEELTGQLVPYLDDSTQLRYRVGDVALLEEDE